MPAQYMSPYINFQGKAREAMEFYRKALGGKLDLQAADDKGVPKPAGPNDRIYHSRLDADGVIIMASDGHPSYPPTAGDNIAIALAGTDKAKLTKAFADLSAGGKVKQPLTDAPWGAFGWFEDKFGINWMVSVDKA